MQPLFPVLTERSYFTLLSEYGALSNGFYRNVQIAEIDTRSAPLPSIMVADSSAGTYARKLGIVKMLEEIPCISFSRRLAKRLDKLIALGALALFCRAPLGVGLR